MLYSCVKTGGLSQRLMLMSRLDFDPLQRYRPSLNLPVSLQLHAAVQ